MGGGLGGDTEWMVAGGGQEGWVGFFLQRNTERARKRCLMNNKKNYKYIIYNILMKYIFIHNFYKSI